jgi:hypothetical protein
MEGVNSGYPAKTADPFVRDDKGRAVTFRNKRDSEGRG